MSILPIPSTVHWRTLQCTEVGFLNYSNRHSDLPQHENWFLVWNVSPKNGFSCRRRSECRLEKSLKTRLRANHVAQCEGISLQICKDLDFKPDESLPSVTTCYLNPLVPDAHYSERRDTLASLQNKPTIRSQQMINWWIFTFCIPGTNGLSLKLEFSYDWSKSCLGFQLSYGLRGCRWFI